MLTLSSVTSAPQKIVLTSNTSWYLYNFRKGTIKALLARGCEVICISPPDHYSTKLKQLGATHIPIEMDGKSTAPGKELKTLLSAIFLLKKIHPSCVFNFTIKMNLYMGLACRMLAIPYVNNISGLGTVFLHDGPIFKLAQKLYGIANNSAQKVFFQNEEDHLLFSKRGLIGKAPTETLPGSGVDTAIFERKPMPAESPKTFLMVARLIGDKGVREYIQAAQIVRRSHEDVRFLLVGPAGISNKTAISPKEIDEWHREGTVEYFGEQEDVRPWIEKCHVIVLPSYREGMPRVILEAASMGRPAIVTNVPGCRQSIEEGITGWFCEKKSADSLAEQIKKIIQIPNHQLETMGMNARKRVEKSFSETKVIESYLNCINQ